MSNARFSDRKDAKVHRRRWNSWHPLCAFRWWSNPPETDEPVNCKSCLRIIKARKAKGEWTDR